MELDEWVQPVALPPVNHTPPAGSKEHYLLNDTIPFLLQLCYFATLIFNVRFFFLSVNGTVSGWGALQEGGLSPLYLHFVEVPFVNDDDCNSAYQQVGQEIVDSMICAGLTGKDACKIGQSRI